jgi:hypothetical protein
MGVREFISSILTDSRTRRLGRPGDLNAGQVLVLFEGGGSRRMLLTSIFDVSKITP